MEEKKTYKRLNFQDIVRDADYKRVLSQLGIDTQAKGRYTYILCPNPGHNDQRIGSCIIDERGYKCFSCGDGGNIINLVEQFTGMTLVESAKFVMEASGLSGNSYSSMQNKILSKSECELIGLKNFPVYDAVESKRYLTKDERQKAARVEHGEDNFGEYAVTYKAVENNPLRALKDLDEGAYKGLVKQYAETAIKDRRAFLNVYQFKRFEQYDPKVLYSSLLESSNYLTSIAGLMKNHGIPCDKALLNAAEEAKKKITDMVRSDQSKNEKPSLASSLSRNKQKADVHNKLTSQDRLKRIEERIKRQRGISI